MVRKIIATVMMAWAMMWAVNASAQVKFGLKAGANVTDMKFNTSVLKADNRMGFFAGPTVKFTLPIVGVNMDLSALYDQREAMVQEEKVVNRNIMVPLHLRYSVGLGRAFAFFLYAGPQFAFNLTDNKNVDEVKEDMKSWRWRESNLSVNVGGGFTISHIEISAHYNVMVGRTGDFDFNETVDVLKEGTARANAWQVGLAYFF